MGFKEQSSRFGRMVPNPFRASRPRWGTRVQTTLYGLGKEETRRSNSSPRPRSSSKPVSQTTPRVLKAAQMATVPRSAYMRAVIRERNFRYRVKRKRYSFVNQRPITRFRRFPSQPRAPIPFGPSPATFGGYRHRRGPRGGRHFRVRPSAGIGTERGL